MEEREVDKTLPFLLKRGRLWGTSGHFILKQHRNRNKIKCRNTQPQKCQDFHSTQPEWPLCGCFDKHCRLFSEYKYSRSWLCVLPEVTTEDQTATHHHMAFGQADKFITRAFMVEQLKTKCMAERILPPGKAPEKVKWGLKRKPRAVENFKCQRFHLWNPGKT